MKNDAYLSCFIPNSHKKKSYLSDQNTISGTNNKRSYARGQGNVRFDFAPEDPYMGGSGGGSQSPRFSTPIGSDVKPLLLDLDKVLHHQACFETHTGKFKKCLFVNNSNYQNTY